MPRIKGPNGLSLPVSDDVAAALLRHPDDEYELVEPEKAQTKKATAKRSSGK